MIKLVDYLCISLNNKDFTISVFADYQKAFDMIHHQIILNKLECYSIRGPALKLLKSNLQNRKYATRINKYFSTEIIFNIELPQGSFFSPLLSIIYVNGLQKPSTRSSVLLFADDTTLLFSHKWYEQVRSICNTELFKKWKATNRLSLTVEKTCHVSY